jgi:hypothetical protein
MRQIERSEAHCIKKSIDAMPLRGHPRAGVKPESEIRMNEWILILGEVRDIAPVILPVVGG